MRNRDDRDNWLLITALLIFGMFMLALTGCATAPQAREARPAMVVEPLITIPAPPAARLCEAETAVCYELDDAWEMAATLDAAFALQAQAQGLHSTVTHLDAEARALDAAYADQEQAMRELMAAHWRERWAWRLGAGALSIMVIGVAR